VRKRPVEVEAIQFTGETANVAEILAEIGESAAFVADQGHLVIYTLEGPMTVSPRDWIIKGTHGEFYPCKPDIFAETYEMVE
jgi:hypothetical protein